MLNLFKNKKEHSYWVIHTSGNDFNLTEYTNKVSYPDITKKKYCRTYLNNIGKSNIHVMYDYTYDSKSIILDGIATREQAEKLIDRCLLLKIKYELNGPYKKNNGLVEAKKYLKIVPNEQEEYKQLISSLISTIKKLKLENICYFDHDDNSAYFYFDSIFNHVTLKVDNYTMAIVRSKLTFDTNTFFLKGSSLYNFMEEIQLNYIK